MSLDAENNLIDLIYEFLDIVLSRVISPGAYDILRFNLSKKLGEDVEEILLNQPDKFYRALSSIWHSEYFIEQVDIITSRFLKEEYDIEVEDEKVFRRISSNEIDKFVELIRDVMRR
jgi:RecA/RadA recombinase